ncbi:septum formation initiator family protein [Halobacteriovorax sp. GB3]|uniref:FtsB family cell division protein n=1 Tax=Halobacteriovorax sp. GB3 TaxID=2719615 RepID=UPI0023617D75|nr:septum formation initiator family protein [Halobacteriovorax sp. GB3]MDD0853840.1 septum formation initiator family protein [Halobacteriovorax sp. GB3]
MEFSFNRPQGEPARSSSNQSGGQDLANERLRKAIERNRQKKLKKQVGSGESAPRPAMGAQASSSSSDMNSLQERLRAHKEKKLAEQKREQSQMPPPPPSAGEKRQSAQKVDSPIGGPSLSERLKAKKQEALNSLRSPASKAKAVDAEMIEEEVRPTRKTVARPDDSELVGTLRKQAKAPATVSYAEQLPAKKSPASSRAKRTVKTKKGAKKSLQERFNGIVVKSGWVFCIFLLGRLIFSDGGIVDFYASKSLLQDRVNELTRVEKENVQLQNEIEKIKSNKKYQKKIVRDNLGFIARDEFLVLFPKDHSRIKGKKSFN